MVPTSTKSRVSTHPSDADSAAPSPLEAPKESWGWTRAHRLALAALLTLLFVFLAIQYFRRPYLLDAPITLEHGPAPALATLFDPNTADESTLSRIPHVGEKLARAIVSYRELHHDAHGIAFQNLADLDQVTGIGKKTLEELRPYLQFPGSATQPAPPPHGLMAPTPLGDPVEN